MRETDWQTGAARLFCYCVWGAGAYLMAKYILPPLMPLIICFLLSWAVSSAAERLSRIIPIPRGVWAFLLVSGLLFLLGFGVFYVFKQLIIEIKRAAQLVAAEDVFAFLPVKDGHFDEANEIVRPLISQTLSTVGNALGAFAGRVIKATPSAFLTGVVCIVSCYYISVDFERIRGFLLSLLPKSVSERISKVKKRTFGVMMRFFRGYTLLFILTFIEALFGLLIICPSYAWMGALLVSVIDILPVLGAGLVLIPWGIAQLIGGEYFVGIGLLVLYVIITVVRQIAEPKVLGSSIGIHPLGAIVSMFLGYRLLGGVGMIAAPVVVAAIKTIREKKL